jgi:hypothetical protein
MRKNPDARWLMLALAAALAAPAHAGDLPPNPVAVKSEDVPPEASSSSVPGARGVAMPEVTIAQPSINPAAPVGAPAGPVKSLLYTQSEIASINNALAVYASRGAGANVADEGKDFLNQLQNAHGDRQVEKFFVYPQFYLESLAYHTPSDWSVRINGRKLTQTVPKDEELHILAIDKEKTQVEWKPLNMQKVAAVWNNSPDSSIDVDLRRGTVIFTLRHNQTFSSYVMRVLEGKVRPVIVENKPDAPVLTPAPVQRAGETKTEARAQEPALPASTPIGTTADKSDAGLGGLIGAYRNLGGNP